MNGAWGVFADYTSNHLIVSDRQNGLFLFDFDKDLHSQGIQQEPFGIYPNPVSEGEATRVRSIRDEVVQFDVQLIDPTGKCVFRAKSGNDSFIELNMHLSQGIYAAKIHYKDYLGDEQISCLKLMVL